MDILINQLREEYLIILILVSLIPTIYFITFSSKENDERGKEITNKAYHLTYLFFLTTILILFLYHSFYNITFQGFRSGIIALVLISNCFLGSTIFLLNKKY
ncbi:hypothetical protein U8V97_16610 [Priestia filamentosa]|uniref:hypothetical protein n=1 Tax=Priestia filamentosa TaxID=1402861 RepID=UPI00397D2356